uniref:Uncharacterized protein n=1 Tax=Anguilla anguilla TaxID=7936 RepID=A0A0E9RV83_ANGAN
MHGLQWGSCSTVVSIVVSLAMSNAVVQMNYSLHSMA